MPRVRSSGIHAARRSHVQLVVRLRLALDGPSVGREPVSASDLVDARSETWWSGHLRKGFPDTAPEEVRPAIRPLFRENEGRQRCAGFKLHTVAPSGEETSCVFSRTSMRHVAARGADKLITRGILREGELYYYDLDAQESFAGPHEEKNVAPVKAVPERNVRLSYEKRRVRPLLEQAEAVGECDDVWRVFYTREACEKAEVVSRRGAASNPPIETGGVLVGSLYSCPESGDMFGVVWDVIEATDSEGTTFTLSYSSLTWSRIQAVMKAKQAHPATRTQRILGQVHGHNFLPGEPCEECARAEVCPKTTAFLSGSDLTWCRAVFSAQPWQLSQIFGLNARGDKVDTFYGQLGATLVSRGYYLIDRATAIAHMQGD